MELFVQEAGSFGAPVVLFLHGSPLSGRMWQPQLDLMKDFHCVAPDFPGHGQSAAVKELEMDDLVDTLANLIRSTSPNGKAHLVGLAYGGVVAQALMVRVPELVDRVVLSGTYTRANRLLVIYQVLNMPILRLLRPKQHAAMVASQFSIPPEYHEQLLDDLQHFSVDAFNQVMHSYMQINLPAKTASPTLVAVGEKETGFAKRSAPALCRGIPGAKGVVAPGLGHLWNLQNPGLFSAMLRAWLAGQPLPDGLLPLEP